MSAGIVRRATVADHEGVARLFVELGAPEGPPDGAAYVARFLPDTVVWCVEDEVVGYAHWARYGLEGHLKNVVVDASHRGQRGCARLMEAVAQALVADGATHWGLSVKMDNEAAQRAYLRQGFVRAEAAWCFKVPWDALAQLPASDPEVEVRRVPESAWTPMARALGISEHRLRYECLSPACVPLGLWREGVPLGFASFRPDFPGAYPCEVAAPCHIGTLLRACCAHRDPDGPDYMIATLLGDEGSRDLLAGVGAELLFPLYRMTADLTA